MNDSGRFTSRRSSTRGKFSTSFKPLAAPMMILDNIFVRFPATESTDDKCRKEA